MEGSNGLGIGGLFALHGGDDDFVAGGKLLKISVLVGLCFTWLEALGEEVPSSLSELLRGALG